MNRLSRYIFIKFLGSFILFMGLVMMIAIVFDISQKVDNFINKNVSLYSIIFDYYINFIAFYGTTFSSLIVFLSTIFVTGRMARGNERAPTSRRTATSMSGTGRMTKRCSIKHFQVWAGGKMVGVGKAERTHYQVALSPENAE